MKPEAVGPGLIYGHGEHYQNLTLSISLLSALAQPEISLLFLECNSE